MISFILKLILTLNLLFFSFPYFCYFYEFKDFSYFLDNRDDLGFHGTFTPWGYGNWKKIIIDLPSLLLACTFLVSLSFSFLFAYKKDFITSKLFIRLSFLSVVFYFLILLTIGWLTDGTYCYPGEQLKDCVI